MSKEAYCGIAKKPCQWMEDQLSADWQKIEPIIREHCLPCHEKIFEAREGRKDFCGERATTKRALRNRPEVRG